LRLRKPKTTLNFQKARRSWVVLTKTCNLAGRMPIGSRRLLRIAVQIMVHIITIVEKLCRSIHKQINAIIGRVRL
jgi:hypothetical protein